MKKVLYSTTALAAAGMFAFAPVDAQAAEKIKLGLGGYFIWGGGTSNSDAHDDQGSVNMWVESEIYFRGNTTLDNGIRVDVIVQLETDHVNSARGGSGNVIDESYLKVGNLKQWGEFRLGTTKQAQFVVGRTSAPGVYVISNPTNFGQSHLFVPSTTIGAAGGTGSTPNTFFSHGGAADQMSAMYVTPNLNGFQAALSFTPSSNNSDGPPQTGGAMPADSRVVSTGVGYKGKFGDASVAITAGHTRLDGAAEHTTNQLGGKVSFAGFSIGGQWAERSDDKAMSNAADVEGFQAGIGYKTGPWQVALTWLNTTDDTSKYHAGETENNQYTLGMAYSLGAGVSVGASVFTLDFEGEGDDPGLDANNNNNFTDPGDRAPSEGAMANEGWGMLAGIRVNF